MTEGYIYTNINSLMSLTPYCYCYKEINQTFTKGGGACNQAGDNFLICTFLFFLSANKYNLERKSKQKVFHVSFSNVLLTIVCMRISLETSIEFLSNIRQCPKFHQIRVGISIFFVNPKNLGIRIWRKKTRKLQQSLNCGKTA